MTFFALLLLATLGLAWLTGRRRVSLSIEVPIRALWLAPMALSLQLPLWRAWGGAAWRGGLFLLSYGLLLLFCALNWHLWSMRLLGMGFLLNFLVIATNGGFMPIAPETLARIHPGTTPAEWPVGLLRAGSKDIVLPAAQTHLQFLSDTLVLPPPFPFPVAFSAGDVFIYAGFAALCWQLFSTPTSLKSHLSPQPEEVEDAV